MSSTSKGTIVTRRSAFSLLELLLALTIGAVLIAVSIRYITWPRSRVAVQACQLRTNELQLRAEEFARTTGRFPSPNLRELDSRTTPLPLCPVDGQRYQFSAATQKIIPHSHP